MNILIVGCGDTGSQLANVLDHMGNQVSVVDRNPETAAELSDSFTGMFTVGVPIDQDVLRHAGIEGCDVVIAVTRDDNTNLMVAQLARDIFGVPKVISRVSDPRREEVFSSFGLSTICPTNLTVASVVAALDDRRKHTEEVYFGSTRISFEQMEIDRRYLGEFAEAIDPVLPLFEKAGVKPKEVCLVGNPGCAAKACRLSSVKAMSWYWPVPSADEEDQSR